MEKKLEVKDLKISFKTSAGKVQAVREISFDLYKGETLAIVGESGSGKSVTSKAIMGILAGNSIVENGEILYDGQDLLKISEEDFHKLRGNKISMIFQDPMSSLNPIVKIGRQLTEAMILKGKAKQRECRKLFNTKLELLLQNMIASSENDKEAAKQLCQNFNKFEEKHIELEKAYNISKEACEYLIDTVPTILFEIEKKAFKDSKRKIKEVLKYAEAMFNPYLVVESNALKSVIEELKANYKDYIKAETNDLFVEPLTKFMDAARNGVAKEMPNFFAMGYYLTFSGKELPNLPIEELNKELVEYFENNFNNEFKTAAKRALVFANNNYNDKKKEAIKVLNESISTFDVAELDKVIVKETLKKLENAVKVAINPLELKKDSKEYTFFGSVSSLVDRYFTGKVRNIKEQNRFDKETAKINKIIASGKVPEWKPVPASIVDFDETRSNIIKLIKGLVEHFEQKLVSNENIDFDEEVVELIEFLKENASGVVNKVTKQMAKIRAIKVMEEVGIPEARKRFYQYPFEFSGGMRQRIVIAIALVSNPDILICDEPTTALDVTIQANILELINKLKRERQLSIIFITHDLGVVANMADHVAVMYAGKIVEYGTSEDIFYEPAHPYTWALLSSIPDLDTDGKLEAIPGTPPNMIYPPIGDAFAERNKYALQIDFEEQPPMFEVKEGHYAATWLLHPNAPEVVPPKAIIDRIQRLHEVKGGSNDGK